MDDDLDVKGCCASFFATIAVLFTLLANFWCSFVGRTLNITTPEGGTVEGTVLYYGIWNWMDYNSWFSTDGQYWYVTTTTFCRKYSSITFDAWWKTAQSFSIIATVVGGIVAIGVCCVTCVVPGQAMWKLLSLVLMFTTLFQGLTFLFLKSEACQESTIETKTGYSYSATSGCVLSSGGKLNITAVVCWFVTALIALVIVFTSGKDGDREGTSDTAKKQNVEDVAASE